MNCKIITYLIHWSCHLRLNVCNILVIELRKSKRSEETVVEEKRLAQSRDEWLIRENILSMQRTRVEWLRNGDHNTRFFHAQATHRKTIDSITCSDDTLNWFSRRNSEGLLYSDFKIRKRTWDEILRNVPRRVSDSENIGSEGLLTKCILRKRRVLLVDVVQHFLNFDELDPSGE